MSNTVKLCKRKFIYHSIIYTTPIVLQKRNHSKLYVNMKSRVIYAGLWIMGPRDGKRDPYHGTHIFRDAYGSGIQE